MIWLVCRTRGLFFQKKKLYKIEISFNIIYLQNTNVKLSIKAGKKNHDLKIRLSILLIEYSLDINIIF